LSAIPLRRIEGKYEILEKLGEGGMGAVYKVRHRLLDDVRVIKMMRPQLVADEEFKARFQREARVAIQLRHPNIAHLIDFTIDEEDGTAFIVMEFIAGMTLEEVLRHSGPPPLGLALEIGQQSLRALACLHEKGFVHRDISPDNLMLTADADGQPLVKLIDLGIAKILGSGTGTGQGNLTGTGIFLGKVRYSSPEQFGTEGAAMVDARGDLYSLGIVLYELLTGKYPIQGRDPSSLIAGHLFRPPLDFAESDPGGRVTPALRALVLRVLAKEPAQRFATARELGAILAQSRAPGDIVDGDLRRALTRLPGGTVRVPLTPPGSTQDRLNAQFGLHTTPGGHGGHGGDGGKTLAPAPPPPPRRSPEIELRVRTLLREAESMLDRNDYEGALAHLERGKALAPGNAEVQALIDKAEAAVRQRRRAPDLTAIQEAIETALSRHDYRAAEMRLYQAEASFGEQEVFTRLHERLGELRRRDLEARRRAERLMVALQGIEAAFAGGDLDEGDRLLSAAASTFGEETEIAAFRGRLAALRRSALAAVVAAHVESGQRRRAAADLPGALAEARLALDLDPENGPAQALAAEVTAELARREEAVRQAEIDAREAAQAAAEEAARDAERVAVAAALTAEIEARLAGARDRRAADDLEGALQEARQVLALEPENGAARELVEEVEAERRRREAEARRRAHEAEVAARIVAEIAAHLATARELRAADDLAGALAAARQALALEAANGDARDLAAEIEVEARRRADDAERAARQAAAIAAIEARLAAGDLPRAGALLDETHSSFGELEPLSDLRARLDDLRREAREAEIAVLLARARDLRERDDLEGALAEARRVLALEAGHAPARTLIAEIEAERRRREKEAERAEQLAAAVAAIDASLDGQDPEAAARLLPGIVSIFGDAPVLRERWDRVEELRRVRTRERADLLLAQARALQDGGELEAALGGLREAGRLAPDDPAVPGRVAEVEAAIRQRDEESRHRLELETALAAIDEALERGDLAAPARLLPAAVARFGGEPALRERWERLEARQRKARVEALRGEAASLVQTGHLDRAARKLRQALELDPDDRGIQELLAGLGKRP
jgi:tRNA A-37 threonylcarbamoyl transferase component Bud32